MGGSIVLGKKKFSVGFEGVQRGFLSERKGKDTPCRGAEDAKTSGPESGKSGTRILEAEKLQSWAESTGWCAKLKTITEIRRSSVEKKPLNIINQYFLITNIIRNITGYFWRWRGRLVRVVDSRSSGCGLESRFEKLCITPSPPTQGVARAQCLVLRMRRKTRGHVCYRYIERSHCNGKLFW